VEWFSPPEFIEAACQVMGSIDTDPATSEGNHTGATIFYTAQTNGLDKEWVGNVLLNPPYGKGLARWMHKLNEELSAGRISQVICLVPARTKEGWFHALCGFGASLCFPRKLKFVHGVTGEQKDTAWMPIVIVYVGPRHKEFAQQFAQFGVVTPPLPKLAPQRPVEALASVNYGIVDQAFLARISQNSAGGIWSHANLHFHAFG
jgi:hypothetical protein